MLRNECHELSKGLLSVAVAWFDIRQRNRQEPSTSVVVLHVRTRGWRARGEIKQVEGHYYKYTRINYNYMIYFYTQTLHGTDIFTLTLSQAPKSTRRTWYSTSGHLHTPRARLVRSQGHHAGQDAAVSCILPKLELGRTRVGAKKAKREGHTYCIISYIIYGYH